MTGKRERKELPRTTGKNVEFTFHVPNAMEVYLAGEFNSWDTRSLPMEKNKEGVWEIMVNLPLGRYEYKIFVDGAWMEDMPCTVMIRGTSFKLILDGGRISNPFGTQNFFFWVK
jgi:hypothetical protein